MDQNRVEIVLSAQTAELTAGIEQAISKMGDMADQIVSKLNEIQAASKATADATGGIVDVDRIRAGQKAIDALAASIKTIGEASVDAAREEAGIERNLTAAGFAGEKLESTVAMIKQLRDNSNFTATEIANVVQRMSALGPVSESTLHAVANAAAGAHMGLSEVGMMFARVEEGGAGAARASLMLERQLHITGDQLRKAGAEVDAHGHALADTADQGKKLAQALETVVSSRYPDAAKKAQSATDEFKAALLDLQEAMGRGALGAETAITKMETSFLKALRQDMTPTALAFMGIAGDMGAKIASIGGSFISLAGNIGMATIACGPMIAAQYAALQASLAAAAGLSVEGLASMTLAWQLQVAAAAALNFAIANPVIMAIAAAFVAVSSGLAIYTHYKNADSEAQEKLTVEEAKGTVALHDHMGMLGMTTEQLIAHGATTKDVNEMIVGYTEAIRRAKEVGNEALALKYTKWLDDAKASLVPLTEAEKEHASALADVNSALLTAEFNYKTNTGTLQQVNEARAKHIELLKQELAQKILAGATPDVVAKAQKELRAEQVAQYTGEQNAIKETMRLVEARHKLGQASDADEIKGLEAEIASLRSVGAHTEEILGIEAKLHSARVKQIDELLAKQNDAAKASQKLHEDAAVASIAATTAQHIATSHSNTAAAQDEVALAKFVLASKQATNEATSTEVDNVAHAEIALARATRDEKVQAAQDEVAKVQQAEADKVANAREALAEVQHGIAERAKLGKANADEERKNQLDLQKASEALTLAKQEGFEAVTAAQQKSTDAQAVAEHELTVKTIEEANKRKLAELSAIEEIKVAMLGQAKTQAEIKAQSLEGAVEKGVAGFKGGKVTKEDLKTISDEFLAAKQQQADAEYDIEIEAMRKIAKKWKEARQDTSQYEATQEKIATEHRLNTEIQAIDALLGKLKGLEGGPEMKSLQGQLDKLKAERGQLEGISAPVQAAEQAADKAGDALEGMAKAIVKTTEAAKAAKDENDKNFFDDPKHKSLGLFGGASSIFAEQPNVAAGGGVGAAGGGGGQGANRFAFGWDPSLAQPPSVYTPAQANASAQGQGGGSPSGVTPWGVGVGNPSGLPQYDPGTANAPMYNGGHPMDSRTVPSTGNMPGSKTVINNYTFNGVPVEPSDTLQTAADKHASAIASSPAQNLDGTVGRYLS